MCIIGDSVNAARYTIRSKHSEPAGCSTRATARTGMNNDGYRQEDDWQRHSSAERNRSRKPGFALTIAFLLLASVLAPMAKAATPAPTLVASVALTTNYTNIQNGTALVITVTVTPAVPPATGVEANPTGTVLIYDGTTLLGTNTLYPAAGTSDASLTTLTTNTLPAGQDTLSAVYLGDTFYLSANSNTVTVAVEDFSITPAATNPPENLNINQGSAGSASFVVGGMGGFNGLVQVVCAVPTQDNMTCTATPQQVTPTATVTFVVQTFANGEIARRDQPRPWWPRAAGGTLLAAVGLFLLPFSRRARNQLRAAAGGYPRQIVILLILLVGLAGAGIGCTSSGAIASTGTPLGVATLKITASAYVDNTVVSHSVFLTVDVLAPGATAP